MPRRAGVPVDVAWARRDVLAGERSGRRGWHVFWLDGPTAAGMRAIAARAAGEAGFDPDELVYARGISGRAYALAMIRQVRLGRPPLGDHGSVLALEDWLWTEPNPQRGTARDIELADRVVRETGT